MDSIQKAEKIINLIQEEALVQFPVFPEAFGLLQLQPCILHEGPLGTDGTALFFDADRVCKLFQENALLLRWTYLHVILHVLLAHDQKTIKPHLFSSEFSEDELADLEVNTLAWLLTKTVFGQTNASFVPPSQLQVFFSTEYEGKIISLPDEVSCPDEETLLRVRQIQSVLHCDSHEKWKKSAEANSMSSAKASGSQEITGGTHRNPFFSIEQIRKKVFKEAEKQSGNGNGKHGSGTGGIDEDAELQKRDSLDYSDFLRRFTVAREEAILDNDSFDYIPYHYGLSHYGNLPFIEPLEYKEVNRLDEIAVAIDTSGSCSGVIVRRFLEETWNILRQKENFFSKMRLHLIQCDCMVQEHRIFTSAAEFEEALPNLKIHGHGDTDFQPVFTYLEKLIAQGEIRQLRALLFFTDGDGIYPPTPPPFDTAFVFLNDALQKQNIPDWGIRLNLNLPEHLI